MTKAGADEDELMQKLMAMIGGGAPVGRPTKGQMVAKENAIKGRDSEMRVTEEHYVLVRVNETSSSSFGERRRRIDDVFKISSLDRFSSSRWFTHVFYFLLCVMHRKETRSNRSLRT